MVDGKPAPGDSPAPDGNSVAGGNAAPDGGSVSGGSSVPGGNVAPGELLLNPGRIVYCQTGRMQPSPRRQINKAGQGLPLRFRSASMAERSNLWKLTAMVYEPLWRKYSTGILTRGAWSLREECDIVVEMLKPVRGANYLDLGCSTGVYARAVLEREPESGMVLVDYSLPMLERARKKIGRDARAVYLQCDAGMLPLPADCMDGAVMGGTLNELSEPERVLSELARVLEKGATAVVMHLVRTGKPTLLTKMLAPGGVWIPEEQEVDALFRSAGFELEDSRRAGAMRISRLRTKE